MSNFPTMLYRCPGPHFGPCGSTYEYQGANDQAEYDQLVSDGYHPKMMDAVEGKVPEAKETKIKAPVVLEDQIAVKKVEEPVSNAPPTRKELNAMGKELGLKFDGRTTDKKLSAMIDGALNVVD